MAYIERVTDGLKTVYQTKNDVFILTGSGTGGLEVAVVNTLSPETGFSKRHAESSVTGSPTSQRS